MRELHHKYITLSGSHTPAEFLDRAFESLQISYSLADGDIEKIPDKERLIIIANHPFGALDGLILAHMLLKKGTMFVCWPLVTTDPRCT